MDTGRINWAVVAFAIFAVLLTLWARQAVRRQWTPTAMWVSLAFLLCAGLMDAAPIRGALDPHYPGYAFGYLHASGGLLVTLISGAIIVGCMISSLIAIRNPTGPIMWVVAGASAFLFFNIGGPVIEGMATDIDSNAIQFGQYLTIPGVVSSAILIILLVCPFLVGAIWGARRAIAPAT